MINSIKINGDKTTLLDIRNIDKLSNAVSTFEISGLIISDGIYDYIINKYPNALFLYNQEYKYFEDDFANEFLTKNLSIGDGLLVENLSSLKINDLFKNQVLLRKFNEFLYFGDLALARNAFYNCVNLEEITLPSSITSLTDGCFLNCYKLNPIDLSNITYIGGNAFDYNKKIVNLEIPSTCTKIGSASFRGCRNLKTAIIHNTASNILVSGETFSDCTSLESIQFDTPIKFTLQNRYIFDGCKSLKYFDFSGTTIIPAVSFRSADLSLVNYLPDAITTIEGYAFESSKISLYKIPDSVTSINGGNTFSNVYGIKELFIPNCTIFESTSGNINRLILGEALTSYPTCTGNNAGYLNEIYFSSLTPPSGTGSKFRSSVCVRVPEESLSDYQTSLSSLSGGYSYTVTSDIVKYTDTNVVSILNTNGIGSNGKITMRDCLSITDIPNTWFLFNSQIEDLNFLQNCLNLRVINGSTFKSCTNLRMVTLPASITEILVNAFFNCPKLHGIKLNSKVPPTIATQAFNSGIKIYVPYGTYDLYKERCPEWADNIQELPNGQYIFDKYGEYHTKDHWESSGLTASDAVCIALIYSNQSSFMGEPLSDLTFTEHLDRIANYNLGGFTWDICRNDYISKTAEYCVKDYGGRSLLNQLCTLIGWSVPATGGAYEWSGYYNTTSAYVSGPACSTLTKTFDTTAYSVPFYPILY